METNIICPKCGKIINIEDIEPTLDFQDFGNITLTFIIEGCEWCGHEFAYVETYEIQSYRTENL